MEYDDEARDRARELRREMNEASKALWSRLRGRNKRFVFRREHPIGPYFADFWCAEAKLVVEVDGDSHFESGGGEHDARRDAFMKKQGIEVLRFRNGAVYDRLSQVVAEIEAACLRRTS
jgi:very-short-patch-repair endonuclease